MEDRDRKLTEAAMRYLQLLDGNHPPSVDEFVAQEDPALREELVPFLADVLSDDTPEPLPQLTSDQQTLLERGIARFDEQVKMLQGKAAIPVSLAEARLARELSLRDVAQRLNIPPALMARIERGEVEAATIPSSFVQRLATAISQSVQVVQDLLAASAPRSSPALSYSAQDGMVAPQAEMANFADALVASGASDAQQAEWT